MNREIKFRAWDKPGELMVYSGEHGGKDLDGDDRQYWTYLVPSVNAGKFYEITLLDNGSLEKEQYEGELMQYTGLKDKNGVEIYEGDIVRPDDDGDLFPEEYNEETDEWEPTGSFIVYWSEDGLCFWLKPADKSVSFEPEYNFWYDIRLEVVGNIYENPELIK